MSKFRLKGKSWILGIAFCFPSSLLIATEFITNEDTILELSLEELLKVKVDSASGFSESVNQTPVPVSVITEQMIWQSGATTLRDLLIQYVPGFTQVQDQNEYNIAFRGVYTSSQQKILILLNGQRINSRAYSSATPDFSISLDKLKQIEVIRGPGSSVHGNVALTAVINLVLKTAKDEPGGKVMAKVGNHGFNNFYAQQAGAKSDVNYFAWLHYMQSDGEPVKVEPDQDYSPQPATTSQIAYLDGFNHKPAYDLGVNLEGSSWSGLINARQSHYVEPLSGGSLTGEAYSVEDYPLVDGFSPGAESDWLHLNFSKNYVLDDENAWHFDLYGERNRVSGMFVTNPALTQFGAVDWRERVYGLSAEYRKNTATSVLTTGLQFEQMKVTNSDFVAGSGGQITSRPFDDQNPVLERGTESVSSVYIQYKKQMTDKWLLNSGARYDLKARHTGKDVTELSPRVALIYNHEDVSLKWSYARAYVDPPFWNRYSALPTFRGARDLEPEILESLQFSPEFLLLDRSLSVKFNLFVNQHTDFVFRNNLAAADEPIYTNSGEMRTYGLEQEWRYVNDRHALTLVSTHQKVSSVEFYEAREDEIYNIPFWQANLSWDYFQNHQLSWQLSANYIGERLSPINIALNGQQQADPFPNSGVSFLSPDNRLAAVTLINGSVNWHDQADQWHLKISAQNLLDKQWLQGGSTIHPYPQTGRWIQIAVAYHWR